jgi:hypothetical protein
MNTTSEKRPVGRPRRILTPTETESFEKIISENDRDKIETDEEYPLPQLLKGDDGQIKSIKRVLKESGDSDSLNEHQKMKLEDRGKQLKEWLQKCMIPKSHIGLRPSKDGVQNYDFQKAKNDMAMKEMSSEFVQVAEEYKNIMRTLGRPEEANLEIIRPDSR